jgi:hypothetical protein
MVVRTGQADKGSTGLGDMIRSLDGRLKSTEMCPSLPCLGSDNCPGIIYYSGWICPIVRDFRLNVGKEEEEAVVKIQRAITWRGWVRWESLRSYPHGQVPDILSERGRDGWAVVLVTIKRIPSRF